MNESQAYMHDVNCGEPMDEDEIKRLLRDHSDSPIVHGVVQLLRNRAADSDRAARKAEPQQRDRTLGEAEAYEEAFWFIVGACDSGAEEGDGESAAVDEGHEGATE
jgi:hypothetical protein